MAAGEEWDLGLGARDRVENLGGGVCFGMVGQGRARGMYFGRDMIANGFYTTNRG